MDQLRVTAAYVVRESDLTKAAKLQVMNFLENEATDAQVMALILDGKIQVLDEMAEDIVFDRFDAALLYEGPITHAIKKAKTLTKRAIHRKKRQYKTYYKHGKDTQSFGGGHMMVKSRKTGEKVGAYSPIGKTREMGMLSKQRTLMVPHKTAMKFKKKYASKIKKAGLPSAV